TKASVEGGLVRSKLSRLDAVVFRQTQPSLIPFKSQAEKANRRSLSRNNRRQFMTEPSFGGPYVQVAAICATPLVEQQGFLSVIRIQDRIQLAGITDQMH